MSEKFNSIYLLEMPPTDHTPILLLPQSDPVKNKVMIIIHFIFFPVDGIIHTSIEAQWEAWLGGPGSRGVRCDYSNEDSMLSEKCKKETLP